MSDFIADIEQPLTESKRPEKNATSAHPSLERNVAVKSPHRPLIHEIAHRFLPICGSEFLARAPDPHLQILKSRE